MKYLYTFLLIYTTFLFGNEPSYLDSQWSGEPIDKVTEEIKQLCGETCSGREEQTKIATRAKEIEKQIQPLLGISTNLIVSKDKTMKFELSRSIGET